MAQIGNKNAEKWNEDTVIAKIMEMQTNIIKDNLYTIGSALISVNIHIDWWADMTNKFKDNTTVYRTIKQTEQLIEENIVRSTLDGTVKSSAAFSIFLLKNKFGYTDKVQTEHSGEVKIPPIFNLDEKK